MELGDRLRQARKQKKLTLGQVGELVGVTGGAVTAWENGRNTPNAVMLGKLAIALDVPINWLSGLPAQEEYTISDEVYKIARLIDGLSDKDRNTVMSVLHALGAGANVAPSKEGNQKNRKKSQQ